jgi:ribosomal protein S18 acetylase RimI-like enzyme
MNASSGDIPILVRDYRPADLPAVRVLYKDGLLGGTIAQNDTGLDIDDIDAAYPRDGGSHFWVAELRHDTADARAGDVVGMVGVQRHDDNEAEIRRLRVHASLRRRGIGSKLLETAIRFCHDHGYLKITLDTWMDREPAVKLFEKFRFRHGRTRSVNGKDLLYFYLDLYTGEPSKSEQHWTKP